jgi:hypothetical protein
MSNSLVLKLDRARQDLEYWQKIAEDPKLSSTAAQVARDQVRTYQAAVWCYERVFGTASNGLDER